MLTEQTIFTLDMDPISEQVLCRTRTPRERVRAMELIRKIAPQASFQIEAGALILDSYAAVALRAQRRNSQFSWSETAERLVDSLARNYANAAHARKRVTELQQPNNAETALRGYDLVANLDAHQKIAVAAMTDHVVHGLCLFDEQGSGKTVMTIHAFDLLKKSGAADTLVVFAPKNMLGEWEKDFRRFTGGQHRLTLVTGAKSSKYLQLTEPCDVYVTNYETAHLLEGTLESLLKRNKGRVVLVVDESFFVKNRSAKRSAAIRRLRRFVDRCWVLCGTPAPNSALDLVHQFDVADAGVTFRGVALPEDPNELTATVKRIVENRGVYLRRLKLDVLPDLPGKEFRRVLVPLSPSQSLLYSENLEGLVRDVESTSDEDFQRNIASFLSRRMLLFQICSNPSRVFPEYEETPGKLVALDELLPRLIEEQGEKVVIWSFFRRSLDSICRRYERYSPAKIDGSVADARERSDAVERFQNDPATKLFIGNPAAAGAGITLTRARVAIYESFSNQAAHYLQSLDRIHRRGQARKVDYYILLARDTIEEGEYERLLRKEEQAAELFSDSAPESIRRDVFLAELLAGQARVN